MSGNAASDVRGRRLRRNLAAIGVGVLVLGLGALAIPHPPSLSTEVTGDPELAARVAELAVDTPGARDRMVVAVIDGDRVTMAGFGADGNSEFEIGSVTKTFTAGLFAEAVARGEVAPSDRVGDHLDLADAPVADATLEELASQRSGLPRVDARLLTTARSLLASLTGADPYAADADAVLDAARAASIENAGEVTYSNLGMALLGQALAAAAGVDYATLVEERIAGPLGMRDTRTPVVASALGEGAPTGYSSGGRPVAAWTLGSYAPAGGVRSTLDDMTVYAQAMLGGDATASEALDPRFPAGDDREIGWAWFTSTVDRADLGPAAGSGSLDITWHNGMTGGFASMVALDRDSDRAVVVLSDTAVDVDALAFTLLAESEDAS